MPCLISLGWMVLESEGGPAARGASTEARSATSNPSVEQNLSLLGITVRQGVFAVLVTITNSYRNHFSS